MLFDQYEHTGTMIEQKKTLALEVGPCLIQEGTSRMSGPCGDRRDPVLPIPGITHANDCVNPLARARVEPKLRR